MKKFYILLLLLCLAPGVMLRAQQIDARLTSLVPRPSATRRARAVKPKFDPEAVRRDINVEFNPDGTVQSLSAFALLKPGAECPTERLESLGISVSDVIGPLVIMQVPAERLYDLEGVGEIERVVADQMNELHTDVARDSTGVTMLDGTAEVQSNDESETMIPVWQYAGLPHAYTGKGVVVGVVDQGIEYNHIAFRDAEGTSRVKKVMNGFNANNLPISYTDPTDIAAKTTDYTNGSHGTHTSGIAAGSVVSSYTTRDVRGVAPETDLVLCGLGSSLSDSRIIESVKGVFQYADSKSEPNKLVPAVVNISLGSNVGRHDGLNPCCIAFNELTLNGTKPGRVIVISAGNEGGDKMSIQQTLGTPDADGYQLRTLLETANAKTPSFYYRYYGGLSMIAYSTDGQPFDCDLKVVELDQNGTVAQIYPLSSTISPAEGEMSLVSDSKVYNKTTSQLDKGIYYHYLSVPSRAYLNAYNENDEEDKNRYLGVFIKGEPGQTIRMTTHSGKATFEGTSNGVYTQGTPDLSINTMACTDAAISVGAYITRASWPSIAGGGYRYSDEKMKVEGAVTPFSSYGIDCNGIARPDILAPGAPILSAYNGYDESYFSGNAINTSTSYKGHVADAVNVSYGGNTSYYYGRMQGTSQAAPMVTGIIALWMEQDPTLSTVDVRRILRLTANHDEFTTDVKNIPSGNILQANMGKVNALNGMKMLVENSTAEKQLTLQNAVDNTEAIAAMDKKEDVTVTLDGRIFYKDGAWNTLCLPFDVKIGESPLNGDGVTVMELQEENSSLSADGTLTLNFAQVPVYEKLLAGTPYLIKWDNLTAYSLNTGVEPPHTIENPVFRYVTIDAAAPKAVTLDGAVTFQGTYTPLTVAVDGDPNTLYLGSNNTLYYPSSSAVALNAQRAYFHINAQNFEEAAIRSIILHLDEDADEDVSTGIIALSTDAEQRGESVAADRSGAWYTLQGVRLTGTPKVSGIYLRGGRKVWVK